MLTADLASMVQYEDWYYDLAAFFSVMPANRKHSIKIFFFVFDFYPFFLQNILPLSAFGNSQ